MAAGRTRLATRPLTQITPANVGSLKVAWTYDTGDAFKGSEMQCQPVVAHGVLYATSPKLRVFALERGDRRAEVELRSQQGREDPTRTRIRGLMYWERGDDRRIYFARGTGSTRSTRRPASRLPGSARTAGSTCARASRAATRGRSASA